VSGIEAHVQRPGSPAPNRRFLDSSHHLTKADPEKNAGLDHYAILSVPLA